MKKKAKDMTFKERGKKDYISYYTDELKNFVSDIHSEEINLLVYNFGGVNNDID